jgi:hypothetical protein
MAARRVKRRGRSGVAIALIAVVLVAVLIVWRRTVGVEAERTLEQMADRRRTLEAERARLESRIREAESRGRLAPVVERRLGMTVATDSQYVVLPRARRER